MANLGMTFDANELPQGNTGSYDPLPEGWYTANITGADLRQTKSGTGEYIAVRYDITGPTHEGRVVWGNLNIKNANPKAEEIGRQNLGELMRAIGLPKVTDTDDLIGGSLQIKLKIRTQEGYSPSNDVAGFKAVGAGQQQPPAQQFANYTTPQQQQQAPAPQQQAAAAPPWARK